MGLSSPALDADALAIGGTLVALPTTPQITAVQNCDGTATLTTDTTGVIFGLLEKRQVLLLLQRQVVIR